MKKNVLALQMGKMASAFNDTMSKERMQIYYDLFSDDYTDQEIIYACENLLRTFRCEYGVKFPLPCHFIEFMEKAKNERLRLDLIANNELAFKGIKDVNEWHFSSVKHHLKNYNEGKLGNSRLCNV